MDSIDDRTVSDLVSTFTPTLPSVPPRPPLPSRASRRSILFVVPKLRQELLYQLLRGQRGQHQTPNNKVFRNDAQGCISQAIRPFALELSISAKYCKCALFSPPGRAHRPQHRRQPQEETQARRSVTSPRAPEIRPDRGILLCPAAIALTPLLLSPPREKAKALRFEAKG